MVNKQIEATFKTTLCPPALWNVNHVISCDRFDRIAHTRETMAKDGINSLTYTVVKIEKDQLFTKITVDVGKQWFLCRDQLKTERDCSTGCRNQMCLDISSQMDNFQSGLYIFKKTLKYLEILFCHLCTLDGEHGGPDFFCPVYKNCSAAKGDTQGFNVAFKRWRANLVLSQIILLRKKTLFWAIWWKQHIKLIWIENVLVVGCECELLCMGLFSLFKSEYLRHSWQAKQCKKIWAIPIKGFGYFIILYQTGIFGLSHICLLLLRIASHYLVAVPGYLCFTEPFKWLLSLLGMRCLNVLACNDAYWTMILFAGAPKCLAALHLKSH